jgi:hypothetical protein
MTNQAKVPMPRPNTDLDFQAQLTDPFTSSEFVDPSFTNKFRDYVYMRNPNTQEILTNEDGTPKLVMQKDLWGILQIFNRDWRLGNIDKQEEAVYIRYYLDLTSDILTVLGDDYRECALISMERALSVNETSQSKGGFLRKLLNTFIHKTTPLDDDKPKKRNMLGLGKKKDF